MSKLKTGCGLDELVGKELVLMQDGAIDVNGFKIYVYETDVQKGEIGPPQLSEPLPMYKLCDGDILTYVITVSDNMRAVIGFEGSDTTWPPHAIFAFMQKNDSSYINVITGEVVTCSDLEQLGREHSLFNEMQNYFVTPPQQIIDRIRLGECLNPKQILAAGQAPSKEASVQTGRFVLVVYDLLKDPTKSAASTIPVGVSRKPGVEEFLESAPWVHRDPVNKDEWDTIASDINICTNQA